MSSEQVNSGRRRFLGWATAIVGAVGAAFLTVPFIKSLKPSARAQAAGAPIEVDISGLKPGDIMTVDWRGQPVWVLRRTQDEIDRLSKIDERLVDPESDDSQQPPYAKNENRSIEPEYLVVIALCTHLGCVPTYKPQPGNTQWDPNWPGGFLCPCHLSRYDLAGRVFKDVPAPLNLVVPPYMFLDENRLLIGAHHEGSA